MAKHKLDLRENSADSCNEALSKYREGLAGNGGAFKFAILHLAHALELLFKSYFAKVHPLLPDIYKKAPPVVIHNARMEVRGALYKLLGLEKTAMDWWSLDGMPDEQLIGRAKKEGKLKGSLLKAVVELMMIHNDAVNTIG